MASSTDCVGKYEYSRIPGTKNKCGVLFLPGFRSSRHGTKGIAIEDYCQQTSRECVRLDYRGHSPNNSNNGFDDTEFCKYCLTDWIDDGLHVLDNVMTTSENVVLVGASMGGWIAVHMALQRPDRIRGIVGIGAAPDFTEDLWNEMNDDGRQRFDETGMYLRPSEYSNDPYPITRRLIEDGRQWTILDRVDLAWPPGVRLHLLHGKEDVDISWQKSALLVEKLMVSPRTIGKDSVMFSPVDDGDHRLSRPTDLAHIVAALSNMCEGIDSENNNPDNGR